MPYTYRNNGQYMRFVARNKDTGKFYHVMQSGCGEEVSVVRVDETLNVTIHEVLENNSDGFLFNPVALDVDVTYS